MEAVMVMVVVHLLVVEVGVVPLENKKVSALSVVISLLYVSFDG